MDARDAYAMLRAGANTPMQRTSTARGRLSMLVVTGCLAVVLVACGRASPADIDAALGITPSPTFSAEQITQGTEQALAADATRTAAQAALQASPVEGQTVELAAAGNAASGGTTFRLRCLGCHGVVDTARGPSLTGPANPSVALADQQLFDLVRTGEGHAVPPGPFSTSDITDRQLIDILAYIREQSK